MIVCGQVVASASFMGETRVRFTSGVLTTIDHVEQITKMGKGGINPMARKKQFGLDVDKN